MKKIFPFTLAILMAACQTGPVGPSFEKDCWQGLSSDGSTSEKPFVASGRKAQIVGPQNLTFTDMGSHISGEMGGVWMGRIKMADGFWMKVSGADGTADMLRAQQMTVYPHYIEFDLGSVRGGIRVACRMFASDREEGAAVTYIFQNQTDEVQELTLDFLLNSDLSPAWYSFKDDENAEDLVAWNDQEGCFTAKDKDHEWYSAWSSNRPLTRHEAGVEGVRTKGPVASTALTSTLSIRPGKKEEIAYFMSASLASSAQAVERMKALKNGLEKEVKEKALSIGKQMSHSILDIPDADIQRAYDWTIINNRWLEQDIEQLGYFLSAGAVEYPWLFGCDMSYSLQGQLCLGNFELVRSTLEQLWKTSEEANGNGRIIHERSNGGLVFNHGNTQETSHFIMALWQYYLWTGDLQFISQVYPYAKKGIMWLKETMDKNGNLYPEGPGIMEVAGLDAELIDVAVYTQQALECMAKLSGLMDDPEGADAYSAAADRLKDNINREFWDEDKVSYCDFYATASDALRVMDGAIIQAKSQSMPQEAISFYEEQKQKIAERYAPDESRGWFSNMNWVVATPMECGIVEEARAHKALEQIEKNNYGPYGPYLSAVEQVHMMTISTGVQAMAEARYGRIDKALECLRMMAGCMNLVMPGAITEMLPDYGCPFQAWTVYGFAKGLVGGFFGIQPDAAAKTITVQPIMPTGWTHMALRNVKVGNNSIDLDISLQGQKLNIEYKSEQPGWKAIFRVGGEEQETTSKHATVEIG